MRRIFKNLFFIILIGIISGMFSGFFLFLLEEITEFRISHLWIIFFLPLFGLLYKKALNKLPDEMSFLMAPFIFLASLGTHLFGGSAGREGVGVLMGTSSAQIFKTNRDLKDFLVPLGVASGFSSIFGTPLAGIVFALELEKFKDLSVKKITYLSLSSYVAHFVSGLIIHHTAYPQVEFDWSFDIVNYVITSTLAITVAGYLFFESMERLRQLKLNIVWVSILIVGIIFVFDAEKYTGIGIPLLKESLTETLELKAFFYKFILTVLTLSVGYKGGEVTPIFILGANLSTYISSLSGLKNITLSGSLGMLGLFGALANTPLAAGFMALEIFNWETAVLVLITGQLGKLALRRRSIYQ